MFSTCSKASNHINYPCSTYPIDMVARHALLLMNKGRKTPLLEKKKGKKNIKTGQTSFFYILTCMFVDVHFSLILSLKCSILSHFEPKICNHIFFSLLHLPRRYLIHLPFLIILSKKKFPQNNYSLRFYFAKSDHFIFILYTPRICLNDSECIAHMHRVKCFS